MCKYFIKRRTPIDTDDLDHLRFNRMTMTAKSSLWVSFVIKKMFQSRARCGRLITLCARPTTSNVTSGASLPVFYYLTQVITLTFLKQKKKLYSILRVQFTARLNTIIETHSILIVFLIYHCENYLNLKSN